jgi:non-canonical purine NTP pyrophosphatase (RdgB/HAM1 family)
MAKSIQFLTGNAGKIKEAKAIVGDLIAPVEGDVDLPEIQSTNPREVLQAKIEAARRQVDGSLIVEDTSLFLSGWGKGSLPGPYIKDFLKTIDTAGLCDLAQKVGAEAKAITWLGYYDGDTGETHFFAGELAGTIASAPRGGNGFGWDPTFIPADGDRTIAEMTDDEKNQISMRKQAFEKLREHLHRS